MPTVRVYDLAKERALTTKEVLDRLQAAGMDVKTHSSTCDGDEARAILSKPLPPPPKPAPKTARGRSTARARATAKPAGTAPQALAPAAKPTAAPKAPAVRRPGPAKEKPKAAPAAPAEVAVAAPPEALKARVVRMPKPAPEAPAAEAPPPPGPPSAPTPVLAPPSGPAPPSAVPTPTAAAAAGVVESPPSPPLREAPPPPPRVPSDRAEPLAPTPSKPAPPKVVPPKVVPQRVVPPKVTPEPSPPAGTERRARPQPEAPRAAVEPPRPMIAVDRPKEPVGREVPVPVEVEPLLPLTPGLPAVEAAPEPEAPLAPAPPPQAPLAPAPPKRAVKIGEGITVKEFGEKLGISASELIKRMIKMGIMATINMPLDVEAATKVAASFGVPVEVAALEEVLAAVEEADDPAELRPRPPVVTIMGHVDHGKTSLLDAIRHTNVIASEAGGITQHIGAYEVDLPGHPTGGGRVVFLDTPGHEAFTAMRARGAQVTDVVVLVVAADDGVMPQTVEAVNHARDAKVPILVAINKMDKPGADPNRVKQQLAELGLVPEEWGGQTIFVEVSAKKRSGIQELLDMLVLFTEIQELKANPNRPARGAVVEAQLDKGRGPVATVLVQRGTLRVGEAAVAGLHHGRVRALINDKGRKLAEAGPATPVEVLGLSGVPLAGDAFVVVGDERKARQIALTRQQKHREELMAAAGQRVTLEDLHRRIQQGEVKELRLIIKGDVQGSLEPLRDSLERLSTEAVKLKVIHSAVGAITETDVLLASASNAIVMGFAVRPEPKAQKLAEQERVDIRLYTVIYEAVNQIKAAMEGLLEPQYVERPVGRLEVRNTFNIPKVGVVAGCYVADGKVVRDGAARLVRDGRVTYAGRIASLRRFKEDVREVTAGYECGVGLQNYQDVKVGDIIETFELEAVAPKL